MEQVLNPQAISYSPNAVKLFCFALRSHQNRPTSKALKGQHAPKSTLKQETSACKMASALRFISNRPDDTQWEFLQS
jgi:hypothetical protein